MLFVRQLDKITGVLLVLLSLVIYGQASTYPDEASNYVKYLAVALCLLAAVFLVQTFRKTPAFSWPEIRQHFAGIQWASLMLTLLFTVLYVATMKWIGFIIGTIVFIMVELALLGVRKASPLVGISVISTAVLYVSFGILLSIRLPAGILDGIL